MADSVMAGRLVFNRALYSKTCRVNAPEICDSIC